jgi:hypothetical protein
MTTISDYSRASSSAKPQRFPIDLFAVMLWSLVGLMLSAIFAVSGYTPDLPVVLAIASG